MRSQVQSIKKEEKRPSKSRKNIKNPINSLMYWDRFKSFVKIKLAKAQQLGFENRIKK
jgi:hypothetical protein